ncbi:hypothetical protein ACOSP7_006072 [Xanthoceras sorbifolium]
MATSSYVSQQSQGGNIFSSPFNSQLNCNLLIKLDRSNYPLWRAQVLPVVRAYNLEEYIFDSKPAPAKYAASTRTDEVSHRLSDEFFSWKKNDQLFVCWMISTLSPSVVGEVTQCVTVHEVWITLERLYSRQSKVSVLHIRSQMQTLKKESMSMGDYILKMKSLADCLTAAGQLTNDQDVITSVLNGLGLEYDYVVMLITSREDFTSFNEAQYLLMAQEHRLERATSAASLDLTNTAANFATSNQRFQRGRGNNNRGGRERG